MNNLKKHKANKVIKGDSRRSFMAKLSAGTIATVCLPGIAIGSDKRLLIREFGKTAEPSEIIYKSVTAIAEMIRKKQISAVEVVNTYIDRIDDINYRLNAVTMECFDRALEEAKKADQALAKGNSTGSLHGVPMTIKDSFMTEGVVSTGGTIGKMNYIPKEDATVVDRLRNGGGILLGKTNTPEFTLIGGVLGVNSTNNIIYGISKNPYDLNKTTSGSSGGAGAIVASGGSAFDVGTDWGGSVRGPSSTNGIAGIKPTSVRLPRTGHIVDYGGLFDLWQQPGPMARYVKDLDLLTPIMAGPDFKDAAVVPMPWPDYKKVDLSQLKVAFFPENGIAKTDPATIETVKKAAKWMDEISMDVVEDCPKNLLIELGTIRRDLIIGDGWQWLKRATDRAGSKTYGASLRERLINQNDVITTAHYTKLLEMQDANRSKMLQWFAQYDVIICPSTNSPAGDINSEYNEESRYMDNPGESYTKPFNTCGWPGAVVRCGQNSDGLPIGVQIVAQPWREDVALAVASYLELKSGGWQKPSI
ncbi:amidase [uncultured Cyclobacterium sp.]|uniref:amidase n=1 Tax=uncultured Cyclobacterium sp. TaxID=453820 RepID=UPI0030EE2D03|tara:strand:+ start:85950 stop:87542 length:1593 start_codon:yes stop_codon:yes gene_type:complete